MMRSTCILFLSLALSQGNSQNDSIAQLPLKISHAEPVYMDIIRDLGARKGEKELNVGWEANDNSTYLEQRGFVEYEFSPLNRLGLEIEIPFCYRYTSKETNNEPLPHEKIEGIKLASQYTFLVSAKHRMSIAVGAIYEIGLHSFGTMSRKKEVLNGREINPFLIIAKRLGRNFHSLLYAGPVLQQDKRSTTIYYQANLSLHYVLPGSGHFIGIETNHDWRNRCYEVMVRPQVKIKLDQQTALGLATGIPLHPQNKGLSFMLRFIYEPK